MSVILGRNDLQKYALDKNEDSLTIFDFTMSMKLVEVEDNIEYHHGEFRKVLKSRCAKEH